MKKLESFQVVLTMVLGLVGFGWYFNYQPLLILALMIGFISLLFKSFAHMMAKAWMNLAMVLGQVNAFILLGLVFFFFLSPLAWLMRLVQKSDALKLKRTNNASVFEERNHTYTPKDLSNIW